MYMYIAIPRSKLKSYGDRAFSVCAPKLWNDIPEIIKCSVNLNTFKRNLKTYLFKRYFNEWLCLISIFNFFTLILKRLRAFGKGAIEIVIYYYIIIII